MSNNAKATISSPKSPGRGVIFNQFPRQFLWPYGEADDIPSPETVFRRIQTFTCEWLVRPKVALSEFSETILTNLELIKQEQSGLFCSEFIQYLEQSIRPINEHLQKLDRQHRNEVSCNDMVEVLKHLYQENDEFDALIDRMFKLGGAVSDSVPVSCCQNCHLISRELRKRGTSRRQFAHCLSGAERHFVDAGLPS